MEMIYKIFDWDKNFFLFLNGRHHPWLDYIMLGLSSYLSLAIVCTLIVGFMIYKDRRWGFSVSLFFLLSIGFNALINNMVKWIVARPRPIHIESWQGIIYAIEHYESSYSFYSGHSSFVFCIAAFSSLFFRNKVYGVVILLWALAVSYSRIYLGKHYPIDIACGIVCGALVGICCYRLFEYYRKRKSNIL